MSILYTLIASHKAGFYEIASIIEETLEPIHHYIPPGLMKLHVVDWTG